MYRFARRPLWIVSHLLVLTLVVIMVNLGLWQVRRHGERSDRNALIEERTTGLVEPWASAVFGVADTRDGSDVEYTPVSITGTYDAESEFVVLSRSQDGAPGRWVVTPLRQSVDGPIVLILRGFIPLAVADDLPPIDSIEPPAGEVTVEGWLRPSVTAGGLQADRSQLSDHEWARIDIDQYRETVADPVAPVFIQLATQTPVSDAPLLTAVPLPGLDAGPHVGYAAQWLIFSTIAVVGYALILRKAAERESGGSADGSAARVEGGPGDGDDA